MGGQNVVSSSNSSSGTLPTSKKTLQFGGMARTERPFRPPLYDRPSDSSLDFGHHVAIDDPSTWRMEGEDDSQGFPVISEHHQAVGPSSSEGTASTATTSEASSTPRKSFYRGGGFRQLGPTSRLFRSVSENNLAKCECALSSFIPTPFFHLIFKAELGFACLLGRVLDLVLVLVVIPVHAYVKDWEGGGG